MATKAILKLGSQLKIVIGLLLYTYLVYTGTFVNHNTTYPLAKV